MGSNRRYADRIDAQMNKRIAERELAPAYESLPPAVTRADTEKVVPAPEAVPVSAWVNVTAGKVRVEALATAWTKRAVKIEWTNLDGPSNSCRVYRGAIEPR